MASEHELTMKLVALLGFLLALAGTPVSADDTSVPLGPVLSGSLSYVVRVNGTSWYRYVNIALCGASSCCGFSLSGSDGNKLAGYSFTTPYVNQLSSHSLYNPTVVQQYAGPSQDLTDINLLVRKQLDMFSVSVKGQRSKLWVHCPKDVNVLNARSSYPSTAVLSQDGLTPIPSGVALNDGQLLTIDVTATVALNADVWIGYCDQVSCATVQIGGPTTYNDDLAFRTGLTTGSNQPDSGIDEVFQDEYHSATWENVKALQLTVTLDPDGFLMVWKTGNPDRAAVVPLDSLAIDEASLRTSFDAGYLNARLSDSAKVHKLPNPYTALKESWARQIANIKRTASARLVGFKSRGKNLL
ncbi:hypothetical protein ONE63_011600 [Megalurothrips usitatus]|uniref:Uncharacterized protein n=1 Tax=Megalurothrips usitatus TaxID=439358 RepID=A0AAV7X2L6_9NEOP|nr:hypothetical protein ONE63_011600 [Megalurothrips usitatus]